MSLRFSVGLTALTAAALLLCAGCSQTAESSSDASTYQSTPTSSSSSPVSSAPADASESQTVPPAADSSESDEPEALTKLNSFSSSSAPKLVNRKDNQVLVCWTEDTPGTGMDSKSGTTTYLALIDWEDDRVLDTIMSDISYDLLRSFTDGSSLLSYYDEEGLHYAICTQTLGIEELSLPVNTGCFSDDGKSFYYISDEHLYRYNIDNRASTQVALEYDLRFNYLVGLHANDTLLFCSVYRSDEGGVPCTALFNLSTGALILLQDTYLPYSFTNKECYANEYDYSAGIYRLLRTSLSGGMLHSYEISMTEEQLLDSYYGMQSISDSGYLFRSYDPSLDQPEGANTTASSADVQVTLYHLTDASLDSCSLSKLGVLGMVTTAIELSDGTLLCAGEENGTASLYRVNPNALTYDHLSLTETRSVPAVDPNLLNND